MIDVPRKRPAMSRFRDLFWGRRTRHRDASMDALATLGRISVADFGPAQPRPDAPPSEIQD